MEAGSWEAMRLGRFKVRRGEDVKIRCWEGERHGSGEVKYKILGGSKCREQHNWLSMMKRRFIKPGM
jgi:hypothetical protein